MSHSHASRKNETERPLKPLTDCLEENLNKKDDSFESLLENLSNTHSVKIKEEKNPEDGLLSPLSIKSSPKADEIQPKSIDNQNAINAKTAKPESVSVSFSNSPNSTPLNYSHGHPLHHHHSMHSNNLLHA
jgi:hypothetical protein